MPLLLFLSYDNDIFGGSCNRFMYGGFGNLGDEGVFILSIPAFQWFRGELKNGIPRALHTCHTTNSNQLIIIGGVDPTKRHDWWTVSPSFTPLELRDPWEEGIVILDMTTLKFKDFYEAKAKPYEPPELIKSFYRGDKSAKPFTILCFFFSLKKIFTEALIFIMIM